MRGSYEAKHEGTHDHPSGDADILGLGGRSAWGERRQVAVLWKTFMSHVGSKHVEEGDG